MQDYPLASTSQELPKNRLLFRKPRRVTVTVPDHIYCSLLERSSREGRSISNLAAYLLERAVAPSELAASPAAQIQG
jgi:hypothetical protein